MSRPPALSSGRDHALGRRGGQWLRLCLVAVGLGLTAISAQADVFLSVDRLATLQRRIAQKTEPTYTAYLALQREADAQLTRQPQAPAEWYVPGYYRDPAGHKKAKDGLAGDANHAYALALLFRMTGEDKYAQSAVRLLDAWASGLQTLSQKDDSRLSFCYHFPAFILAADLLRDFSGWPAAHQQAFTDFLRTKALPMTTQERENNWGNWGLVLTLAGAVYLRDEALYRTGIERWKYFMETQLAEDGHLRLEVTRNDGRGDHGLWYSHFSLMPQTIAAEIARVHGDDLFSYRSPSGHTLRQAFERLAPWTCEPATFPYYRGSNPAEQHGPDYISYWEILNAHWPQPAAARLLAKKRPLSADHSAPALTFTHGDLLQDR